MTVAAAAEVASGELCTFQTRTCCQRMFSRRPSPPLLTAAGGGRYQFRRSCPSPRTRRVFHFGRDESERASKRVPEGEREERAGARAGSSRGQQEQRRAGDCGARQRERGAANDVQREQQQQGCRSRECEARQQRRQQERAVTAAAATSKRSLAQSLPCSPSLRVSISLSLCVSLHTDRPVPHSTASAVARHETCCVQLTCCATASTTCAASADRQPACQVACPASSSLLSSCCCCATPCKRPQVSHCLSHMIIHDGRTEEEGRAAIVFSVFSVIFLLIYFRGRQSSLEQTVSETVMAASLVNQ